MRSASSTLASRPSSCSAAMILWSKPSKGSFGMITPFGGTNWHNIALSTPKLEQFAKTRQRNPCHFSSLNEENPGERRAGELCGLRGDRGDDPDLHRRRAPGRREPD